MKHITPGTPAYKTWLKSLKVGDKVVLGGKDCPKEERGKVRTFGEDFTVYCMAPKKWFPGGIRVTNWAFRPFGELPVGYFGGKINGKQADYYLLPVPNSLHENTPAQNSKAAYLASKPHHNTHRERILKAIARSPNGACMYGIAKLSKLDPVQVARRLKELHTPPKRFDHYAGKLEFRYAPLIEQTDRLVCKHCKGKSGLTHWRIAE